MADAGNAKARALLAKTYDQMGYQAESAIWRNMYLTGAQELLHQAPVLALLPGLLILLTVIAFNFLGDGLQDALDPRSERRL